MIDVLINQTPCLVILAFVLVCFLKHLDKVNARHDQVQHEATEVIRRCAEALGVNSHVLQESLTLLRTMNGTHKPKGER